MKKKAKRSPFLVAFFYCFNFADKKPHPGLTLFLKFKLSKTGPPLAAESLKTVSAMSGNIGRQKVSPHCKALYPPVMNQNASKRMTAQKKAPTTDISGFVLSSLFSEVVGSGTGTIMVT